MGERKLFNLRIIKSLHGDLVIGFLIPRRLPEERIHLTDVCGSRRKNSSDRHAVPRRRWKSQSTHLCLETNGINTDRSGERELHQWDHVSSQGKPRGFVSFSFLLGNRRSEANISSATTHWNNEKGKGRKMSAAPTREGKWTQCCCWWWWLVCRTYVCIDTANDHWETLFTSEVSNAQNSDGSLTHILRSRR